MMRSMLAVAVLVLAGCAGSDTPSEEADDFVVEVDDQTGAIRGVVVDQSIVPVPDATIELQGAEPQEAITDELGRFSFSKLPPGSYFLKASKPLHEAVQFAAEVKAGVAEPPIIRVQLPKLFTGEPYMIPFSAEGYYTCSQAAFPGYTYGSSPCHQQGVVDLEDYGISLPQNRDFHQDVVAGWQTLVFELKWEPSAQGTSDRMGMVVSTYKPERPTSHWFANVESKSPMRFQLDVGVMGPSAQQGAGEHAMVPPDGLEQMSFFTSVRPPEGAVCVLWCVPPGLALEQKFDVYLHQFVYLPAPEGWSILNGDVDPF